MADGSSRQASNAQDECELNRINGIYRKLKDLLTAKNAKNTKGKGRRVKPQIAQRSQSTHVETECRK
jgi:hypothetical protein